MAVVRKKVRKQMQEQPDEINVALGKQCSKPYSMNEIPLIDWNGNGKIDPQDIALSLAVAESESEE